MATENTEISEKMKRFRKLRNMSQDDLAEASGINISTIKKYEAGFRNPKTGQIKKIANALNGSVNAFLTLELTSVSDVLSVLMNLDDNILYLLRNV